MTEQRPGRKALFVGAPAPAGRSSPDEIAERVRGLNEDLALALKGAAANKAVKTLDASHFGSEYTTLVDAVNAALSKIAAATPGVPAPAGTQPEVLVECEKKINVLERRLEFMEKNNPVPMLIATPSLDITEANAAYVTMSGIPESRILTTNIHKILPSRAYPGRMRRSLSNRNGVPSVNSPLPFLPACIPWSRYCIPVLDSTGEVTSLVILYDDLTTRRKKNEEIERLRARSETIVQQNPMPIVLADMGFKIRVVNDAYVALTGIEKSRLLSMSLRDFKLARTDRGGVEEGHRDRHPFRRGGCRGVPLRQPGGSGSTVYPFPAQKGRSRASSWSITILLKRERRWRRSLQPGACPRQSSSRTRSPF